MALKMKTFKDILNDMVVWVTSNNSKLTNFYVGSVIRTILEGVSTEIESLYFQLHKGFQWAVENAIYNSFSFSKVPATYAVGQITLTFSVTLSHNVDLPKGFQFSTVPSYGTLLYFNTVEDVIISAGSKSCTVNVQCTTSGVLGNVPAGSIKVMVTPLTFVSKVDNTEAFYNGAPEETTEERKKRFNYFISTLARGTSSAITYGCLRVDGVKGAQVSESVGIVDVYVHDAYGNLPDELKARVITSLLDYRSAGVQVNVLPVVKKPVDLTVEIFLQSGYDPTIYVPLVKNSVISYMNNFQVAKPLIRSELIKYLMGIDENAIYDVTLSISNNVTVSTSELIRSGAVSVINS